MAVRSGKDFGYSNDRGGDRTHDLRIKSPLLYRLSYPVETRQRRSFYLPILRTQGRSQQLRLGSQRAYFRPCLSLNVGQSFFNWKKSPKPSHCRNGFMIFSNAIVEEGRQP